MQNHKNPQQFIQATIDNANILDFIRQLTDDKLQLRQIIDELTNAGAIQKELNQQLRDEIACLKGLKPKPKISQSKLEGSQGKGDQGGILMESSGSPVNPKVSRVIKKPFWRFMTSL